MGVSRLSSLHRASIQKKSCPLASRKLCMLLAIRFISQLKLSQLFHRSAYEVPHFQLQIKQFYYFINYYEDEIHLFAYTKLTIFSTLCCICFIFSLIFVLFSQALFDYQLPKTKFHYHYLRKMLMSVLFKSHVVMEATVVTSPETTTVYVLQGIQEKTVKMNKITAF